MSNQYSVYSYISAWTLLNKQLLHTPPLNTMNYLHEVVDISLPRVDNHGIQWRGVCNNSFIIHLHRISGEKDEEGKEMKNERNERQSL